MRLSKSRLLSYIQCPKRLWLEVHCPELGEISRTTQTRFETGHRVGEVARALYSRGREVSVTFSQRPSAALRETQALLAPVPATGTFQPALPFPAAGDAGGVGVYFEATFEHAGVLVRADILERSAAGTRLVEVKSASRMKEEHDPDVAIQMWVLEGAGMRVNDVVLAHINNQFTYRGEGDYAGLLIEEPISDRARGLVARVPVWTREAQQILAGSEPKVPIGQHCRTPHECPFIKYCWPRTEYPLTALPGLGRKLNEYVARGYRDVRDVPEEEVSGETQLRVWRATAANRADIQPALSEDLHAIPYPRYYLDFETIDFTVPIWPGTRPGQAIPFQWSIHVETSGGAVEHLEYLDLSGELPARGVAQSLIAALGRDGPILTYTEYERHCIRRLAQLVPDLAEALGALDPRLVDLHPIFKRNYYHPTMRGSWSIKAVLPAVVPDLRYEDLGEVKEGNAAQRAYLEAINPATSAARKAAIAGALLEYCRFDTHAMVRLVQAWLP